MRYSLLLLIMVLTFCNPESDHKDNYMLPLAELRQEPTDSLTLMPTNRIKIPIDKETSYKSENIQYYSDDNDSYLIAGNQNRNSVDIYSLSKLSLIKAIRFDKTGKFAIKMKGFHFHNFDSIFIYPQYTLFGTILADSTGNVKKKYFSGEPRTVLHHTSKTRMPTFYEDGSIYSMVVPNNDFRKVSFFTKLEGLEVRLDLEGGLTYLDIKYPTSYANHTWGVTHAIPCRIYNDVDDIFIYSYGIDHRIYVFDKSGELLSVHDGSSKYIEKIEPLDNPFAAKDENLNYLLDESYYGDIFYDKYREVYYRLAKLPIKRPERIWENKPVSIIILDREFRKIGEKLLSPTTTYYARDIFIAEDGLYISNNHPLHEEMDEDFMVFTKFELVSNKMDM